MLAVTESWLDASVADSILHIPGYFIYRRDRGHGRGGGVCFYVRDHIGIKLIPHTANVEALFLLVHVNRRPLVCFGCVYRPPNSTVAFWDSLTACVDTVTATSAQFPDVVLMGDFNVDVLSNNKTSTRPLTEFCDGQALTNKVFEPTRTPSNTCLDLLLVPHHLCNSLALSSVAVHSADGITDHHLVTASLSGMSSALSTPTHRFITRRPPPHQANSVALSTTIAGLLADADPASMSLDDMTTHCSESIRSALDVHCPATSVTRSTKPRPSPWVTPALRKLFHSRAHWHRASIRDPSNATLRQKFRAARREGTLLNKRLRSEYYLTQFHDTRSSPREHWRVLNNLLGRQKIQSPLPVATSQLTDHFSRIVQDRPEEGILPCGPSTEHSLSSFQPILQINVLQALKRVKIHKATGSDGVPPSVLRKCAPAIAPYVTEVFNQSLTSGTFPHIFRHANVCPIFKKGDRADAGNYRPISLLPVLSKLLEKHVHNQLQTHISQFSILPPEQFAYRFQHSCEDLLTHCINAWQRALDRGQVVAIAFLDMSKAFDTVSHRKLLLSLQECGMSSTVLAWFANYLSGRSQTVKPPYGEPGATYPCNRGVPQGSVLGPLLFTIYIRQLPSVVKHATCPLYADDVCAYLSGDNVNSVTTQLQDDVTRIQQYLEERGLTLNLSKTEFMVLRRPNPGIDTPLPSLKFSGTEVEPTSTARYLGIVIDEQLTFSHQVMQVRARVAAKLMSFRRVRQSLTVRARRAFYTSFVQSVLEYGSNAYVHTLHKKEFDQLVAASKRAQRIVFGYPPRSPSAPIRKLFSLASIELRFILKLYVFIFRCLHGHTSSMFSNLFISRSAASHTDRITRGQTSQSLSLPPARTRYGFFSLSYLGADRWNLLPADVRTLPRMQKFIPQLKLWLGYPVKRRSSVGTALVKQQ